MNDNSTILVVDDDSDSLRLLTDILTGEGYCVRPADSGQLALASVKAVAPELIMLDIRMPGMDGFEVCRRLQADEKSRRIPVIFLSAAGQLEDRVLGLSLGAADFILKPYQRPELLARVRTHMELEERRRAEQELRESEARFRTLADRAPVGIWITAADDVVTFYNRRALAFLGRKMSEMASPRWNDFVHPDDVDMVASQYHAAVNGRRNFRIECRVRRSNGKYRWVLHTGVARFIGGTYGGYIGTSSDITDLKRSQEETLLHQKLESLGVLAGGVAHDFNNLLGSILAESDLALCDLPENEAGRDNIERIAAIANRASEIVNLLMTYAGERDLTIESVDLSKVTSEVLFLMRPPLSDTADVEINLSKNLPLVQANKAQIRQVVLNLITNAAEALRGRGGKITVSTGQVHIGKATAAKRRLDLPGGDYCYLEVADTGCGMSAKTQINAFDPFYSTKFVGRGLGLAVVQGILRSHGGAITVVSEPELGSTFQVLLPRIGKRARERHAVTAAFDGPPLTAASGACTAR